MFRVNSICPVLFPSPLLNSLCFLMGIQLFYIYSNNWYTWLYFSHVYAFFKILFYRREKRQIFILEFQNQNICRYSLVQQVELNSSLGGTPIPPPPPHWSWRLTGWLPKNRVGKENIGNFTVMPETWPTLLEPSDENSCHRWCCVGVISHLIGCDDRVFHFCGFSFQKPIIHVSTWERKHETYLALLKKKNYSTLLFLLFASLFTQLFF